MRRVALGLALVAMSAGCGDTPPSGPDGSVRGTRTVGQACATGADCASGLCIELEPDRAVCTRSCGADTDCPGGSTWGCVSPENFDERVCGCVPTTDAEICGDGVDNECNGEVDDCRICFGEPVGENDPRHCGECGNECNSAQSCVEGECVCTDSTRALCGDRCLDLSTNETACGSCDNACQAGEHCTDGVCGCPEWAPDTCGGTCVDVLEDTAHCGECGNECAEGLLCRAGECACRDFNHIYCEGLGCIDPRADEANCGACGTECSGVQICTDGSCTCPSTAPELCDGVCTNVSANDVHCGGCGNACTGDLECQSGVCSCSGFGEVACGDQCVRTGTDPSNCGSCGTVCRPGEVCSGGGCVCRSGVYCGDTCMPTLDPDNCGSCGNTCAPDQRCSASGCECTDSLATFCGTACVRLGTDPANCGSCGNVCDAGLVCRSGSCQCPTVGESDCGGAIGCVDLDSDTSHCGSCGTACRAGEVCSYGSCRCAGYGYQWCAAENDCVDTRYSETNCGSCGNSCGTGQTCSGGVCRCPSGQTYCADLDRCVSLQTDEANCGACGNACPEFSECSSGSCQCFLTTETACPDGCTDVTVDSANCGSCGNVCTGGKSCDAGVCMCPAATIGTRTNWYTTRHLTMLVLPDGRLAHLSEDNSADEKVLRLSIRNSDGTLSAGPFEVYRTAPTTVNRDFLYPQDLAWDGTALGGLFTFERESSSDTYFARWSLSGATVTPAVVIDDGRPGRVRTDYSLVEAVAQTSRLFYDPTAGFTAVTVDEELTNTSGEYIGFSIYARHLGADASTMGASRRLFVNSESRFLPVRTNAYRDPATGAIDLFVSASQPFVTVLRLAANGDPRATTLSFDPSDWSSETIVRGIALGASGPEVLACIDRSLYSGYVACEWRYGSTYGSRRRITNLTLEEGTTVASGAAGTILQDSSTTSGLRLERIAQSGSLWSPIDLPVLDPAIAFEPYRTFHTGPDTAFLATDYGGFPVLFPDCN